MRVVPSTALSRDDSRIVARIVARSQLHATVVLFVPRVRCKTRVSFFRAFSFRLVSTLPVKLHHFAAVVFTFMHEEYLRCLDFTVFFFNVFVDVYYRFFKYLS